MLWIMYDIEHYNSEPFDVYGCVCVNIVVIYVSDNVYACNAMHRHIVYNNALETETKTINYTRQAGEITYSFNSSKLVLTRRWRAGSVTPALVPLKRSTREQRV